MTPRPLTLAEINEHRAATGHRLFKTLTRAERRKHTKLIEQYAPHGDCPWCITAIKRHLSRGDRS